MSVNSASVIFPRKVLFDKIRAAPELFVPANACVGAAYIVIIIIIYLGATDFEF